MEMTWLAQDGDSEELMAVRELAEQFRLAVDSDVVRAALGIIPAVGGSSHDVDEVIRPHAEELGFSSQRKNLFAEYPVALRPDWYRALDGTGILLEIERGKTVTNNMDLLDLWKCHVCREAHHLFLVVPISVRRTSGAERVYPRVVNRLSTFFVAGNETNVRSVAILGYR